MGALFIELFGETSSFFDSPLIEEATFWLVLDDAAPVVRDLSLVCMLSLSSSAAMA
jgi:hypothetical protein